MYIHVHVHVHVISSKNYPTKTILMSNKPHSHKNKTYIHVHVISSKNYPPKTILLSNKPHKTHIHVHVNVISYKSCCQICLIKPIYT